jgi:membrane protease YdiL (CAAX protease family)
MIIAGVSVAVVGGTISLACYWACRRRKVALIEPLTYPTGRWNGLVIVSGLLFFVFSASLSNSLLVSIGFFSAMYGQDFPLELGTEPTEADKTAATVRYLWAYALAFPFQVAFIFWLSLKLTKQHPLKQPKALQNVVNGYLMWLLVTPAALCIYSVANMLHVYLTNSPPDTHPLTKMMNSAGWREWGLFLLQTTVLAPVMEELIFRGLLLPWLCQRRQIPNKDPLVVLPPQRSALVFGFAILIAAMVNIEAITAGVQQRHLSQVLAHLIPAFFFMLLFGLYLILPRYKRLVKHLRIRSPQHVRAIIASSALFAAFHVHVWPSPVPLFVLAIGISYLAVRTNSVIGPIVVHSLFNAVSAICLIIVAASK